MKVYITSLKGLRKQNEDKHSIILNSDSTDRNSKSVNFFGLYDGHGGKQVSKFLEENLPLYFMKKSIKYPLNKKYVKTIYDHIQNILRNNYKKMSYRIGSTCLVVIHFQKNKNSYINILNTGDSRCVLCRDNLALPLTKDHKPHWPEELSRIQKLGGRIYFDGDDWRIKDLSVSRAFGDIEATPYVTHEPDMYQYKIDKNDKFMIIACDGLWDVVSNQDAVNFVLTQCYDDTVSNRVNVEMNISQKLGEFALKKGSTDNVSIMVVFF